MQLLKSQTRAHTSRDLTQVWLHFPNLEIYKLNTLTHQAVFEGMPDIRLGKVLYMIHP